MSYVVNMPKERNRQSDCHRRVLEDAESEIHDRVSPTINVYSTRLSHTVGKFTVRPYRPAQEVEKMLIAALGPNLNSAAGGVFN